MIKREPAATDRDFGPHVASCEYFTVDKVILDGLRRKKLTGEADGTSFVSVLLKKILKKKFLQKSL